MALQNLIHCGRVLKPHGLKGELCTIWFTDSPLLLSGLPRLYLRLAGSRPKAFNVLSWREHGGKYLVFLDSISGRDLAEKWQGAEILVSSRHVPKLESHQSYFFQLISSRVFLTGDVYLGVLENIFDYKGNEVWRILTSQGAEVLFPVHQGFIQSVDTDNRIIVIEPPDGLLEIYGVDPGSLRGPE